ncbi:MAG: FlgD immunoglobulin-like domain containing protein [bacterium]
MYELFGLAFKLLYDQPGLVQILSVEPNPWIGTDVIFFSNTAAADGRVSLGLSRKAGQGGVNGTGVVARVKAKIAAQAPVGTTVSFSLQDLVANNAAGTPLRLNPLATSVAVDGKTAVDSDHEGAVPLAYQLAPNHPNPFKGSTAVHYQIPQAGWVTVKIFNANGQEVRTVVKAFQEPGYYSLGWDGRDEHGQLTPSGVYIYRLQAGSFAQSYKMLRLQ